MSLQYKDGTFSKSMPLSDAIIKFEEAFELNTVRSLHVGTDNEIQKIKDDYNFSNRLDEIESKISDMNAEKSKIINIPSKEDIDLYAR